MTQKQRAKRRHAATTRILKRVLDGMFCRMFHYERPICDPTAKPFIVLANHNTDFDPILIQLSFPQMYFMASEHVFRKGLWSRLLVYFFNPISRLKGSTDAQAALDAIRRIRSGDNVCLFAEGNRSFNGVTGPIFPATGKLVKASGAMLVTFRFTGGYMTSPRWSKDQTRKGAMRGCVMGMYPPEEIKAMSAQQVNQLIANDLFEDAYQTQKKEKTSFAAKDPAEYMQVALYTCPKCGAFETMASQGDRFYCAKCGMSVSVDEYGFLHGDAPYDNLRDWDEWQNTRVQALAAREGDQTLFSDPFAKLHSVDKRHNTLAIEKGPVAMSKSTLSVGKRRFALKDISAMGVYGRASLAFSVSSKHYEIKFPPGGCGRKYFTLFQYIKKAEVE